jgi:hypothetical protein
MHLGVMTRTQPEVPKATFRGSQKGFSVRFSESGVLKGVQRGPGTPRDPSGYQPRDALALPELGRDADQGRVPRVIPGCHFSVQLNHFIPGFLSYSVAVVLK